MTYKSMTRRVSIVAAVALLPATFAFGETKEQLELQKEGIQLIRQVEEVARDVQYSVGLLNSFNRNTQISKWTHLHHLDEIKMLVNGGLQPALERLIEIQPQLPEWKQQSIDQMFGAAKALAADTNSAILAKQAAGGVPPALNTEYKNLVSTITTHAGALLKTSDAAGNYAEARLKAAEAGVKVPKS